MAETAMHVVQWVFLIGTALAGVKGVWDTFFRIK